MEKDHERIQNGGGSSVERVAVLGGALANPSLVGENDNSSCIKHGTSDIGILDIPIHDMEHERLGVSTGGYGDIEENSGAGSDRSPMKRIHHLQRDESLVMETIDIEIGDGEVDVDAEPSRGEEKKTVHQPSLLSSEENSPSSAGEEDAAEENLLMQSSVSIVVEEDDDDDDEYSPISSLSEEEDDDDDEYSPIESPISEEDDDDEESSSMESPFSEEDSPMVSPFEEIRGERSNNK